MKAIEGFKLRKLGNESIIVPEGLGVVNFNKMIALNESAAYLWESIADKEFTVEELAQLLIDKYGISEEIASADSAKVAREWIEAGIVSE